MKHESEVSHIVGCLPVVTTYSFMKEIKVYTSASYIDFLFVKMENIKFIKDIKRVFRGFIGWWKPRRTFMRILEQVIYSRINSPKRLARFSPGYEGTENMFNFLNDI